MADGRPGYEEVAAAKNAFDLKLKRALLEARGIPTFVSSDFANEIFGLTRAPFIPWKGLDPFTILAPADRAGEAREFLSAAPVAEESSRLALLDWEHRILTQDGALPIGAADIDMSEFEFIGEAASEEGSWLFFLTERAGGFFRLPSRSLFEPIAPAFRRFPGLMAAYSDTVLKGYRPPRPIFEVFGFCGQPHEATELGKLVLSGRKTGTASLLWEFEEEGEEPPRAGEISIVVDGRGRPLCAIETESVEILPFKDVGPEHARAEGEGDLSLEYWRKVHRHFFSADREGRRPFDETAPVVCELFRIAKRFA